MRVPFATTLRARGPGEAKFPKLWDRLVLSAAPCVGMIGRHIPDLSPARFDFNLQGTTAFSTVSSPIGPAGRFDGNAGWQQTAASWGLPCKVMTGSVFDEFTLQAVFRYQHADPTRDTTIFWSDNPTVGSTRYGYRVFVDTATDLLKCNIYSNDDLVTTLPAEYTSSVTLTDRKWHNIVIGYGPAFYGDYFGINLVMWIDGVFDFPAVSGTENFGTHLTTQHSRIGSVLASTTPILEVALINVWNRAFCEGEVRLVTDDPLRLFRPAPRAIGKVSSGRIISIGGTAIRRSSVAVAG